jgi:methyl-accepting chemotaxis protein
MKIKNIKIGYRLAIEFSIGAILMIFIGLLALDKIFMVASWQDAAEAWGKYDATPAGSVEQELKSKIDDLKEKYYSEQAPLLDLSRRSSGLTPEFHAALKQSGLAFNGIVALIKDDVNLQASLADTTFQQSQDTYEQTKLILLIATLVTIVLSAAVALSITLSLSEAVAEGDLTVAINVQSNDEAGHLCRSLADMDHRLRTIVTDVRTGIESVCKAASQIAVGNADLSQRTEEQVSIQYP